MANKTINQALKDLFLGLGGNESALADNTSASDYIEDLESAIETAASGASADLIDDEEASTTKTYSSSKIASLIPENELPTPAAEDIGKVVSVVSDGESGAEYALEAPSSGGGEISRAISVSKAASTPLTVTFVPGAPTRDQIIASVNMTDNKIDSSTISAFIWYNNEDFTVMFGGDVFLTGVIQINNVYLPVYSGVILNMSGAGGTNTQGDLYQVVFILGATAADDRLEVIKLTTT